jgi:DNA adenine methylase
MRAALTAAMRLLEGRAHVVAGDYAVLLAQATPDDLVYLDPPYQGVSQGKDRRYAEPLARERLIDELGVLNRRSVPYLLSFDGRTGDRRYGAPLPASLQLSRVILAAGPSSQATLSGRRAITYEALYLSPALREQRPAFTRRTSSLGCRR